MSALKFNNTPFYEKNSDQLSLPLLVSSYGVPRKLFSEISGVSESLLSRSGPVNPKTRIKLSELVSIYNLLWKLTRQDEEKIKRWLHEPQDQYWGLSPIQFMKQKPINVQVVLKNLQEVAYGESMGA